MSITEDKKIEVLYDHYKDTFLQIREYIKQRERHFVYVIITIFLMFLQLSFSDQSLVAFNTLIKDKIGFDFCFSKDFFNGILWFVLFSISLRYFQINVLINRQYDYLHSTEDMLCLKSGENDFIRREGREYLKNYPILSDWAHIVYTWIFPILLILIASLKIFLELRIVEKYKIGQYFDGFIFLTIFITVLLYMINIHCKRKEKKK